MVIQLWKLYPYGLKTIRHCHCGAISAPPGQSLEPYRLYIPSCTAHIRKSSVYVMVAKTIGQVDGIMNVKTRTEMEGVRVVTGGIQRLLIRAEN